MLRISTLVIFGAPIVLVLVGVYAAHRYAEGDRTRELAIYGAVVATGGALLGYVKFILDYQKDQKEKQKKEDEKKEKIRARVAFQPYNTFVPTLGVELYNEGSVFVPIKHVALFIASGTEEVVMPLLRRTGETTTSEHFGQRIQLPKESYQAELNSKQSAYFYLIGLEAEARAEVLLSLPPDALELVVESFNGVVATVKGEDIQEVVRHGSKSAIAKQTPSA